MKGMWKLILCLGSLAVATAAWGQAGRRPPRNPGGSPGPLRQAQQRPGRPSVSAPGPMHDAAMGRMTMEIMALREIHAAGFTVEDLERTIPVLREMDASARRLEEQTRQSLERERQALLAAGPSDPAPAPGNPGLREAMEAHAQATAKSMEKLVSSIGERKADCVRRLLGMFGPPMGAPPPGQGPGQFRGPAPGAGQPQPPSTGPDGGAPPAGGREAPGPWQPGPWAGGPQRGPQPNPGWPGPGGPPFPGAGPGAFGQMMPGAPGFGPPAILGIRMTPSELAELMEQKLAAMRR